MTCGRNFTCIFCASGGRWGVEEIGMPILPNDSTAIDIERLPSIVTAIVVLDAERRTASSQDANLVGTRPEWPVIHVKMIRELKLVSVCEHGLHVRDVCSKRVATHGRRMKRVYVRDKTSNLKTE